MFNSYNPIGTIQIHHRLVQQRAHHPTMTQQTNLHQEMEETTPGLSRPGILKQRLRTAASSLSRIMPQRQPLSNRWRESDSEQMKTKRLMKHLIVKEIQPMQEHSMIYDHSSYKCKKKHMKNGTSKKNNQTKKEKMNNNDKPTTSSCPTRTSINDDPRPLSNEDHFIRCIDCKEPCPICWDSYRVGEKVCFSKNRACSHGFHLDCIMTWLGKHDVCPLCRADYIES